MIIFFWRKNKLNKLAVWHVHFLQFDIQLSEKSNAFFKKSKNLIHINETYELFMYEYVLYKCIGAQV